MEQDGKNFTVTAGKLVAMAGQGAMGIDPNATAPMYLENTGHPVSSRLALAHASNSHVHALGLTWDDASGKNNAHYAPFNWRSA